MKEIFFCLAGEGEGGLGVVRRAWVEQEQWPSDARNPAAEPSPQPEGFVHMR